ncbi:MAG TPA: HEAT repeat domain-containing protein [Longimicrobium sp.]|nr:HEAT repeat domain-containing protein [Longimicrobium sp.]
MTLLERFRAWLRPRRGTDASAARGFQDPRSQAAARIAHVHDPDELLALLRTASSSDHVMHRAIEEALAAQGPSAAAALVRAVGDPLFHVAFAARSALAKIGAAAVEPLLAALDHADARVREGACLALGGIAADAAVDPLLAQLKDPDPGVQAAAAESLGRAGDARAVDGLRTALTGSGSHRVRRKAAAALDALGAEPADEAERVARALACERPGELRDSAAREGAAAFEPLLAALRTGDRPIREAAAEMLGRSGDPRAVQPLTEALRDDHYAVRTAAALALTSLACAAADAGGAPLPSEATPASVHPADTCPQPGAGMTTVSGVDELRPGDVIRVWHEVLGRWAGEWSEVVLVVEGQVGLRTVLSGTVGVRGAGDVAGCAWKHPDPRGLLAAGRERRAAALAARLTTSRRFAAGEAPAGADRTAGRHGRCGSCGEVVALSAATELRWDWDGVDAHPFYCPRCHRPDDIYVGRLIGSDGEPIIDQVATG